MKKTLIITALLALLAVGCTNVRPAGNINGLTVTRVTTRGVFSPSTTTIVLADTNKPGTIEAVIANANGQSALAQVANPAAVAAGAYLLKPATTSVSQSGGNATGVGVGTGNGGTGGTGGTGNGGTGGTGGSGQFIPPGHVNNPSGNH